MREVKGENIPYDFVQRKLTELPRPSQKTEVRSSDCAHLQQRRSQSGIFQGLFN